MRNSPKIMCVYSEGNVTLLLGVYQWLTMFKTG